MNSKSKLSGVVLYGSLLAFIAYTLYILYINQEVFYTAHDRSEFIFGAPFFHALLSKPFGLMRYVGAWLTQFFCHPGFGTAVMVVIWVLIFCVGVKVFRLQKGASALMLLPIACLLTSVVDLGYWIYIFPARGYWFSQSAGYLLMLMLLWVARSTTPRKWHFVWYLIAFRLYPELGWFALLFILCLALSEKPTWRELIGLLVLIVTPSIWHTQEYSYLRSDDVVLAGFPRFETPMDSSERLSIPFWVLGAISVLLSLCGRYMARWFVPAISAVAGILFTSSLMFHDQNYIDEMRMAHYAFDSKWKDVLTMAEGKKKPTSTMVFLKNVALMHEGGLLERSFPMGNEIVGIHNPDSVHVSFLEIAGPLTYYNYGMLNEGFRLSFECAVQSGFSPVYLKMLARCAHANGEDQLANRYIAQLHHHPFYTHWKPEAVPEKIRELHNSYTDEITGVESSDGYIVNSISLWYQSDSKLASEQALFYSMLRRDSRRFWASFRKYVKLHLGETFPVPVAEAYILYMDKAPEEKRVMIPVNEDLYKRYKQFWDVLGELFQSGKSREEVAEQMRLSYGDTYWYYNLFSRRVY
ncbi:MAG: hypothetical protein IJP74_09830 [Prevotella sp.]|nr:hypothetical protein [Prevotella sp.]